MCAYVCVRDLNLGFVGAKHANYTPDPIQQIVTRLQFKGLVEQMNKRDT